MERIDFDHMASSESDRRNQNPNHLQSTSLSRSSSQSYAPSAPTMPESYTPDASSHSPPNYNNEKQQFHGSNYGQVSSQTAPTRPQSYSNYGQQQFHVPSYGQPQSNRPPSPSPSPHVPSYGQVSSQYAPPPPRYDTGLQQFHAPSSMDMYGRPYGSSSPQDYYIGQHQYGQVSAFPPGTHPEVIRSFQMVDKDRSGYIDDYELQQALSSEYRRFSLRTIHLLMFLFKNPNDSLRTGPKEFANLWNCLGQWRAIFERFDRDRSGKIDLSELKDALYSLGYAIPPSVLQALISKYDDQSGRRVELHFDSFIECAMIVKGLTEKFKEKDSQYTGSATFTYDAFMSMVIPFLVSYN